MPAWGLLLISLNNSLEKRSVQVCFSQCKIYFINSKNSTHSKGNEVLGDR